MRQWHEVRRRILIYAFWKILPHHSKTPDWRLKCIQHGIYFLLFFWHLWVWFHMDWIYSAEELISDWSLPWIVLIVDFGLGDSTLLLPMSLFFHSCPLANSPTLLSVFLLPRAKDMKNRLAFLRRRNESPGSNPASKLDKSMKSVK